MDYPLDIEVYSDNSTKLLKTSDTVPNVSDPYYVRCINIIENSSVKLNNLDYISGEVGDLIVKIDREKYLTNFDINDNGELIIIGEDSLCYSIDQDGNLIYTVPGGIGSMNIGGGFVIL